MHRFNKTPYLVVLVLASLACGLITNPLNDAKNLASTAQSLATDVPIQTLEALPSLMPDAAQFLNPTGTPVSQWNNIPIMTQATVGQEFNKNTYSYKASGVTASDVQTFYTGQLKTLGWSSAFSAQGGSDNGTMLFTKDSSLLSISVTTSDKDVVVILVMQ